jgi:endonuclease VIII
VPEGDVVWNTAQRLHAALAGQVLTRSDFRVPRYATVNLAGQTVTEALSRGKHLLIRTDRGLTVHTHLKMEGAWRIQPAGRFSDSHRLRVLLANAEWLAAGYQLGITEVLKTSREEQVIGHLGPDLLGPDWDAPAAASRLSREPRRPIGEALLDQRNLAGAGTIYTTEMMFLRGIDPWRTVGSLSTDELTALVDLGHRLLDANKERPGHVTTGDSKPGRENWAYGRAGRPCRRCGTPIRRGEAGPPGQERLRFWCPNCQR